MRIFFVISSASFLSFCSVALSSELLPKDFAQCSEPWNLPDSQVYVGSGANQKYGLDKIRGIAICGGGDIGTEEFNDTWKNAADECVAGNPPTELFNQVSKSPFMDANMMLSTSDITSRDPCEIVFQILKTYNVPYELKKSDSVLAHQIEGKKIESELRKNALSGSTSSKFFLAVFLLDVDHIGDFSDLKKMWEAVELFQEVVSAGDAPVVFSYAYSMDKKYANSSYNRRRESAIDQIYNTLRKENYSPVFINDLEHSIKWLSENQDKSDPDYFKGAISDTQRIIDKLKSINDRIYSEKVAQLDAKFQEFVIRQASGQDTLFFISSIIAAIAANGNLRSKDNHDIQDYGSCPEVQAMYDWSGDDKDDVASSAAFFGCVVK